MFGQTYFFDLIKKYNYVFGTLFNDIHIARTDADGNIVQLIAVPIGYARKDKILSRFDQDPNLNRQAAAIVPIMSFECTEMRYNGTNKLPTNNRLYLQDPDSTGKYKYQYTPVAYDLAFKLYIFTNKPEDNNRILEQIIPFFTPDWTVTVEVIPEMNISRDIPIVLNGIQTEDTYDDKFEERRAIVTTLDFTMHAYFFGPVKKKPVIKIANTNFYIAHTQDILDSVANTGVSVTIQTKPAMLANGQPTTNAALSVPVSQINANDNWDYSIQIIQVDPDR